MFIKRFHIHTYEIGLVFRDGEFTGLLRAGRHWLFDPAGRMRVEIVSRRDVWLTHDKLDLIAASPELAGEAVVLDLADHQRGLVWVDRRFQTILGPGRYVYWVGPKDVRVEIVDAREPRLKHEQLGAIVRSPGANLRLETVIVHRDHVGVLFFDGRYVETLSPGLYAFWKGTVDVTVESVDRRESVVEIGGQDIMTADKVTLRINAAVTVQVADARTTLAQSDDVHTAIYRETQLALRAVIGTRELDSLLAEKESVAADLVEHLRSRAAALGLDLISVGIRDVILPGDMRELMNKVIEARKAAEANLIARREETAAMRSQANTAKLLADNPTLMRLRELEVLEKVATSGTLSVVLGEKGLADRLIHSL